MVIVAVWYVEGYQVIRLVGSLTARATRLAHETQLGIAPLGKTPHLRTSGLLMMGMNSTAIQIEYIDKIAKLARMGEGVTEVIERTMRSELDFTASLYSRVTTLKGADTSVLQQVRENLPLTPGLAQLVLKLETLGWKVTTAPGGLTFFTEHLRGKLRPTAVVANGLEIMDDKSTGNTIGDIVDAQCKAKTLTCPAREYEIPLTRTVVIGDGANDLLVAKVTGLEIAYYAKPKVSEKTEVIIRHADLMGVFYILSDGLNQK